MLRPILFLVFLLFICFNLSAQQTCGTDEVYRKMMQDPNYRLQYDQFKTAGTCVTAGTEIQLLDNTPCLPNPLVNVSFNWTITNNNGVTLTSTDQNPAITIPAVGSYDVTCVGIRTEITSTTGSKLPSKMSIQQVKASICYCQQQL